MKSPISTVENPILFFQYLLFYDGYNLLVKDFLEGMEESQPHSVNFEELSFVAYSPDEFYNYNFRETKFSTSLSRILNTEKLKSVKLIDQKLLSYFSEERRRNEEVEILNSLYSMYLKTNYLTNPGPKEKVQKSLLFIIKHVQNVYFFLDLKHRAFRLVDSLKNKKIEDSFFGCDDYKSKFFVELHDLFYRKSIIKSLDDIEV